MKKIFGNTIIRGLLILVFGVFIGWLIFAPADSTLTTDQDHEHTSEHQVWTCSMHPSVRQPQPGKCPLCGMDLIPLDEESSDDQLAEITMSESAVRLANIRTMTIHTGVSEKEVRLNGKIQADERRVSSQTTHIPGRIEQLMVNFTGEYVNAGNIIAYVYSPDLVTAQRELLEAHKLRDSQPALYNAAREKLKNWKLTEKQIDEMIIGQKTIERFPILSNVSGIVLKKNVNVGDYVGKGASLYEVTDLSSVWVMFDLYESDIPWVKKGSAVTFTTQSIPGEEFTSTISFIDPVLDAKTRVAKARAVITNRGKQFKPEMFVTGVVKSKLNQDNRITIPKTAVMWTGERSIVYVKTSADNGFSFRMQQVTLGPSLGEQYVIMEGLQAGMEVAVNGVFTIDAASELAGKPSMMNNQALSNDHHAGNPMVESQLRGLLDSYIKLKDALVETNSQVAATEAGEFMAVVRNVDDEDKTWIDLRGRMMKAAEMAAKSSDIDQQRAHFSALTEAYHEAINLYQVEQMNAYYQYCPMAINDKGAYWISKEKEIRNPYFGSKMLRCGETRETLN